MERDYAATSITEIEDIFAGVVRKTGYGGKDLVLIETYDGPRPQEAYATVTVLSGQAQDHESKTYFVDEDGQYKERLQATNWVRVLLQFFGGNAMATANKVKTALFAQDRLFDLMRIAGIGDIGEVQKIDIPFRGRIESRARFTVDFYALLSEEYDANYVAKVVGTISAEGGAIPFKAEAKT